MKLPSTGPRSNGCFGGTGAWAELLERVLNQVLDELIQHLVRIRWSWTRAPKSVTLVLDSTVCVRYGRKQAGAEVGYNPKKPGRPSHHPGEATAWRSFWSGC